VGFRNATKNAQQVVAKPRAGSGFMGVAKKALDYWPNQIEQLEQNVRSLPSTVRNAAAADRNARWLQSKKAITGEPTADSITAYKKSRADAIRMAGGG
jgi:hypothetical protein